MKLKEKLLGNYKIFYKNEKELDLIYKNIFKLGDYRFFSKRKSPFIQTSRKPWTFATKLQALLIPRMEGSSEQTFRRKPRVLNPRLFIIDCGSHIGISILYFKYLYPNSEILGFEPDPDNFEILKKNIKANGLKKVTLINRALSDTTGRKPFYTDKYWSWRGSLINSKKNPHKVFVRVDKLSRYINRPVDLVKIDIEGSEEKVLTDIKDKFKFINNLIIEFHSREYRKVNNFYRIKEILAKAGYKLEFSSGYNLFNIDNYFWKYVIPFRGGIIKATKTG